MIFYASQTYLGLLIAGLPAIGSLYTFFVLKKKKTALLLLIISAFLLRLLMVSLDPYLQDWDERFHALVAKNMMDYPFKPMLRVYPIMPYDYKAWCCNHIWVHKQPLFLWQMALSMKIFGVNEIAMRLPSAVLGTITVLFIYQIASFWTKNNTVAYISAFVATFSFYQLGLIAGRFSSDHNDLAFTAYVIASIWAFIKYLQSNYKPQWAIAVGVFVACAILNKWLTGLLVYGAWVLWLILSKENRNEPKKYGHIIGSIITTCLLFLPWQLYMAKKFPLENAWEQEFNQKHIFEAIENHSGSIFYHLHFMQTAYGKYLLPFLIAGLLYSFFKKEIDTKLSVALVAIIIVLFSFFSLVVATKMPSFVYPVSALIIILIALGFYEVFIYVASRLHLSPIKQQSSLALCVVLIGIYSLKPWAIAAQSDKNNETRNAKINNTIIYKNLPPQITQNCVVINCKSFEDVELMFYQNVNAYHWYPEKHTLDSLQHLGYKFAAFKSHNNQVLPEYIVNDTNILIINKQLK